MHSKNHNPGNKQNINRLFSSNTNTVYIITCATSLNGFALELLECFTGTNGDSLNIFTFILQKIKLESITPQEAIT
jgi:hypothetical protein